MKNKTVVFVPDFSEGNPYQNLLSEHLAEQQHHVEFTQYPHTLFPLFALAKQHNKPDILHVHWVTELIKRTQWSSNKLIFLLKCLLTMVDCWLTRLNGTKVIWTIHNKVAHEQLDTPKELFFRRCFARSVSKIIVHSEEALAILTKLYGLNLKKKANVIFHGNYLNVYPEPSEKTTTLKASLNLPVNAPVISYVGMIKPYKGVETLIKAFIQADNANAYLLLSGKVSSKTYEAELNQLINHHPRIFTQFQFLSDQALIDRLAVSDYVCLPFSDTLTSGSTILAMSQQKALILPNAAKVFGCVPEKGVNYFDNADELINIINTLNQEQAKSMGHINLQKAQAMSWQTVADLTVQAYNTK